MKITLIIITVCAALIAVFAFTRAKRMSRIIASTPTSFYELSYTDINGKTVSMSEYKGKYVLCVNVASECGNTPQYSGLQKLYEKHKDKLVIIGFPCNQFLSQEPGTEKEIQEFCTKNYGVTFPLSGKIDVKGANQHPLYSWLTTKAINGVGEGTVAWNFHKFLVGKNGEWVASIGNKVDPLSKEIEDYLK